MSLPYIGAGIFPELAVASSVAGAALSASATPTSLLPAGKCTLPANKLYVGSWLRLKAGGIITTASSAEGNLTLDCRLNSTPIVVFNGGAMALAASKTNVSWMLEMDMQVVTVGSGTAATILGIGTFLSAGVTGSVVLLPATSPAAGTGFDSTVANLVDLYGTLSATGNSITCSMYELTFLG